MTLKCAALPSRRSGWKMRMRLTHLLPRMVAAAEDRAQASDHRRHLAVEQARLQVGEQLQRGEQRVDLGGVEPQARQLVARPGARSCRSGSRSGRGRTRSAR